MKERKLRIARILAKRNPSKASPQTDEAWIFVRKLENYEPYAKTRTLKR